mmetsp:Transcript_40023/g.75088  ORF Transcript_40023/g.75088 Transcript_40023/m.75088 type:complete len:215 (-) Transcript_40023:1396-2040(-)
MHSVPVYISEMAPPSIRGLLIAGKEAFVVLGMLTGYCTAALFISQAGGWRWMYAGGVAIAGVFGAGVLLILPDSPRWLLLRSLSSPHRYLRHEARNALKWFRGSASSLDLDAELAEIVDTLAGQACRGVVIFLFAGPTKMYQQTALTLRCPTVCGIYNMLVFAKDVLSSAGCSSHRYLTFVCVSTRYKNWDTTSTQWAGAMSTESSARIFYRIW